MVRNILAGLLLSCCVGAVSAAQLSFESKNNDTAKNDIDYTMAVGDGAVLEDHETVVTVGTNTPLGGPFNLHGGTLSFSQNALTDASFDLATAGTLIGNDHMVSLPYKVAPLVLPSEQECTGMHVESALLPGGAISSFDWSSNSLLAVTTPGMPSTLQVYSQRGYEVTLRADVALPGSVAQTSWCPTQMLGVVGLQDKEAGATSSLYQFVYQDDAITLTPLTGHAGVIAVTEWSPDGQRLLVAEFDEAAPVNTQVIVSVYQRTDQRLDRIARQILAGPSRTQVESGAWRPDGQVFVLGRGYSATQPQFEVYAINSDYSLTQTATLNIMAYVSTVAFAPGTDVCLLGLTAGGGSHRLRACRLSGAAPTIADQANYVVHNDVHDIAWYHDGSLCAVASRSDQGVSEVAMYKAHPGTVIDLERCGTYINTNRYRRLDWAEHDTQLGALDTTGKLFHFTAATGVTLENITLLSNSPLRWQGALYTRGNVVIDGQRYAWHLPADARWQMLNDAQLGIRNAVLAPTDTLSVYGAEDSLCVLENCHIAGGHVALHAPTRIATSLGLNGTLSGPMVVEGGTRIELTGDATLTGVIHIDGSVSVAGNGYRLDVSNAAFVLSDGAQVMLHEVDGIGLSDSLTVPADAQVKLSKSSMIMTGMGALPVGQVAVTQSSISYQQKRYTVDDLTITGGTDITIWSAVSAHGLAHTGLPEDGAGATATPTVPGPVVVDTPTYALAHDLYLTSRTPLEIRVDCTIRGNGHVLHCARADKPLIKVAAGVSVVLEDIIVESLLPGAVMPGDAASRITWGADSAVTLGGAGALRMPWQLAGNARVDGDGYAVSVSNAAGIQVLDMGEVELARMQLLNIGDQVVALNTATTRLTLRDVDLHLSKDFVIRKGEWHFAGNVGMHGGHMVRFISNERATILAGSNLRLAGGCNFEYSPQGGRADGLDCNPLGALTIDNSSLITKTGAMRIGRGRLVLVGHVALKDEGAGLFFGDAAAGTRMQVQPEPGSFVHMYGNVSISPTGV